MSRLDAWHEPRQEKKFWSQVLVLFFVLNNFVCFFLLFLFVFQNRMLFSRWYVKDAEDW